MTSSTSSASRALPLELIEEILREDVLDKSDYCSLSRVSHKFCNLARPRLFSQLTVETPHFEDGGLALTPKSRLRLRFFEKCPELANLVRAVYREDSDKALSSEHPRYRVVELADLWHRIWTTFPRLEEMHDGALAGPLPVPACASTLRFVSELWLINKSSCEWLLQLPKLQRLWCSFGSGSPGTPGTPLFAAPLPFALTELRLGYMDEDPTHLLELIRASSATLRSLDLNNRFAIMSDFSDLPKLECLAFRLRGRIRGQPDLVPEQILLRKSLRTSPQLETLVLRRLFSVMGGLFELLADPEISSLLPKTLEQIDCNDTPSVEQCERLFGTGSSVRVLGVPISLNSSEDANLARSWCEDRGIIWKYVRFW